MAHDEMGFCELRNKEIVNETDGRRLGKTCDLIFSPHEGNVLGIVAPFNKRGMFFKGQEVFIPFKHISKIGPDVILVRLTPELSQANDCVSMGKNERQGRFESRRSAAKNDARQRGGLRGEGFHGEEFRDDGQGRDGQGRDGYERGYGREDSCNAGEYYQEDGDGTEGGFAGAERTFEERAAAPDCDFKCEKCMLFDCEKRWKGGGRPKKRPAAAYRGEEGGSAYVDGKLI